MNTYGFCYIDLQLFRFCLWSDSAHHRHRLAKQVLSARQQWN
nr:MAG TPA: hypothetical protein [Caudoviricetes sp.]